MTQKSTFVESEGLKFSWDCFLFLSFLETMINDLPVSKLRLRAIWYFEKSKLSIGLHSKGRKWREQSEK